jgi:D-hydroxyproline dehydrogenase subunit beta
VAAMLRGSVQAYRELPDGTDVRMTARTELLFARDEERLPATAARAEAFAAQGVGVERLTAEEVRAALPELDLRLVGGYALDGVYTVDAEAATRAFAEAARAAGATVSTGVRVGAVAAGGLTTDAGPVAADAVVVATGPWMTDLVPGAAVRGGRGWLMRTSRLEFPLPWIVEEDAWPDQVVLGHAAEPVPLGDIAAGAAEEPVAGAFLLCPLPDGDALVGASLSTSLRDAVEGADAPRRIAARALEVAPGLAGAVRVVRAWSGLRPMTPDGLPVVGAAERDGVYLHGGHASLGMQAAPATAAWLAALMHSEPTHPTMEELRPDRFS